jgi:metal-responsive CopG/Arc/MetJ family transcriptional regulator
MIRTQIYLTRTEQLALRKLSRHTGRTRSELIREAVDQLIARTQTMNRRALLKQARGIWHHKEGLPDFAALRRELDRPAQDAD